MVLMVILTTPRKAALMSLTTNTGLLPSDVFQAWSHPVIKVASCFSNSSWHIETTSWPKWVRTTYNTIILLSRALFQSLSQCFQWDQLIFGYEKYYLIHYWVSLVLDSNIICEMDRISEKIFCNLPNIGLHQVSPADSILAFT